MAGTTAELKNGVTYYFKDQATIKNASKTSATVGDHWINGYNGEGRMTFRQIWGGGAVNLYDDGTSFKRLGWSSSSDIMHIYVKNESDVVLTNGDASVGGYNAIQSRVVVEYPADSNKIYKEMYFNRLDTRQSLSFRVPANSKIYWGRIANHYSSYYSYKFTGANTPPTQPGGIAGINEKELKLTGEAIDLTWGKSTDEDGDKITYGIEFYNGKEWVLIKSEIEETKFKLILPKAHASNARIRIRAKDSKDAYSEYTYSSYFQVYRCLYILKTGNEIVSGRLFRKED